MELDVSRNFHNPSRRALAVMLGTALHEFAAQEPVAQHPKVSDIWQHSVMLFRAIHRYDEEHIADLARSLYYYGCSLNHNGRSEGAAIILREAVRIFERLHDADPNTHRSNLASASSAYSESLQPRKSTHVINVPRPSLWTAPPTLVVSIVIGHQHSSVTVAFWQAGTQALFGFCSFYVEWLWFAR